MHTPPRNYHGAEAPGDPGDGASGAFEPAAWESIASAMVGTVIDGRYRVDALLGAGAMAFVLDGHHVNLGKRVAIKVLHPELAELGELRARFQREARAASRVAHPAVIEVTDFGVSEDGLYYLVMEHLAGVDLHRYSSLRGPLPPEVVAGLGRQLAGALHAIHQAGFVHRDIKPENIFVLDGEDPIPTIKVLDLGIAAVSAKHPNKDDPRLTRAGQTLGTVSFMAPEQVAARPLDGRVDIYAAGCVLFELVTGRLPFEHETATEIMMAHLREAPPDVRALRPEVPDWLAELIARCLAKRPEDRYPDALALARALEAPSAPAPSWPLGERSSTIDLEVLPKTRARAIAVALGAGLAAVVATVVLVSGASTGTDPALIPVPLPAVVAETPSRNTGLDAPLLVPRPGESVRAEADTIGGDAVAADSTGPSVDVASMADTSDTDTSLETTATSPDAGSKSQATGPTVRPKVTPRDPPRPETAPSAPKDDTSRTPSGLWRPRPPSDGGE